MAKKARSAISRAVRDQVLDEFNHRCAVCGADHPQLHHLDEDPANNVAENLIPLCANDHLTDQHNPTRRIEPEILKFFRIHKDPFILLPQFSPLFQRMGALSVHKSEQGVVSSFSRAVRDLICFVEHLEMGPYYIRQLVRILDPIKSAFQEVTIANTQRIMELKAGHLRERAEVDREIVELLRYQRWEPRKRPFQSRGHG